MHRSLSRIVIPAILFFSFQSVEAQPTQVVWTASDHIQTEIEARSTLDGAVRWLHPGNYLATDTTGVAVPINAFSGNLALRNLTFSAQGNTVDRFGLLVDGNLFMESGGVLNAAAQNGSTGLGVTGGVQATGAEITATGSGSFDLAGPDETFSRGISISNGDFRLTNSNVTATGREFGEGITLENGNFVQVGGSVIGRGTPGSALTAQGIYLKNGNYEITDGTLDAGGESGGVGVFLDHGDFVAQNATIKSSGDGFDGDDWNSISYFSRGISVAKGNVVLNGGSLEATGTDFGEGVVVESGNFLQNGGHVLAHGLAGNRGFDGQGIYLLDGYYELTGGTLDILAEDGGVGLLLEKGDSDKAFTADRGTITVNADGTNVDPWSRDKFGSIGIYSKNGNIRLKNSSLTVTATHDAHGIEIDHGNFVQNGGTLTLHSRDGCDPPAGEEEKNSIGVFVKNGDFSLADASMEIEAENGLGILLRNGNVNLTRSEVSVLTRYGNGIVVDGGNLTVFGGTLTAESFDGPVAIYVENKFDMQSGLLYLKPGDGVGRTIVAGSAELGENLTLRLDINRYGVGSLETTGDIAIAEGARLEVRPFDSVYLEKNSGFGDRFMKSESGVISGKFEQPENTPTLDFQAFKTKDEKEYHIQVTRTAYASEWLQGPNRSLAETLERILPDVFGETYQPLIDAYEAMDRTETVAEMASIVRGLTPWQATRFTGILVNRTDFDQFDLSRNLDQARRQRNVSSCDPCTPVGGCTKKDDSWYRWYSAHGNFAHYGGTSASFSDLDVDSHGFRVGLARKVAGIGRRCMFGVAFNYTHGDIDGSRSDSDFDSYGFLAAFRSGLRKHSWFELSTGYSYARFDQGRYDYSGNRYGSKVDDHLFRFGLNLGRDFRRENVCWTPMAGLDYTWVDQRGYKEQGLGGLGLTVRGDELNSLRLRLGAEMERQYGPWSLSAHGFFRYETLDRALQLDSVFTGIPTIRSTTEGQGLNRCSGLIGSKLDWKLSTRTNVALSYDFLAGDGYGEHRIDLGLRRTW